MKALIETFVHQSHDMKAVESQNRVWRVGSYAASICSAHVHGHRFESSSAELEATARIHAEPLPHGLPQPKMRLPFSRNVIVSRG
jgi:hypothetical protein